MPFNSGDNLDSLLLAGDLDFSLTVEGESPGLPCFKGVVDFFVSEEYLDLVLGGDLECSLIRGEEPDLLRNGDLDFFNSRESVLHLPSGEVAFFFSSEKAPDVICLGEADFCFKGDGDPDLLHLRGDVLGFSLTATDLPDLLCCNRGVDLGSGEAVCLDGDKEFSLVDDSEEPDRLCLGGDLNFFFSPGDEPDFEDNFVLIFSSGEDSDLFRRIGNLSSRSEDDLDLLRSAGDLDFLLNAGDEPDRLLLERILDFSSTPKETSGFFVGLGGDPDMLLGDILDLFFSGGGVLDWLCLAGDLDFFFGAGEEPDLLRLGDNLDFFFGLGEELERLCRGDVLDFFFFDLEEEPDRLLLGDNWDFFFAFGREPDRLRLGDTRTLLLDSGDEPDWLRLKGLLGLSLILEEELDRLLLEEILEVL